ncbi:MAG TPA: hypothetical protein VGP04_01620, partial [Pseudonocardiaceae bacterium]|nr:hypothetical protein [Pseudonocardiaceae bacterium]
LGLTAGAALSAPLVDGGHLLPARRLGPADRRADTLVLTVREDGGVVKPARPVATGVNRTGAGRC